LVSEEGMLHVTVCYKSSALCIAPRQATCLVRDPRVMLTVGLVFVVWLLLHQRCWLRAHKTCSAAVLRCCYLHATWRSEILHHDFAVANAAVWGSSIVPAHKNW